MTVERHPRNDRLAEAQALERRLGLPFEAGRTALRLFDPEGQLTPPVQPEVAPGQRVDCLGRDGEVRDGEATAHTQYLLPAVLGGNLEAGHLHR